LEWRYNDVHGKSGHERETEILSKLLDTLLADQVVHDVDLHGLEGALRHFQRVRHDSFSPNKYREILGLLGVEEQSTLGYHPQLFGNVTLDVRRSA
jgi:hypothetical protein